MFFYPSSLFQLIDAPFSFGMDTVLLPVSIPFAITAEIFIQRQRRIWKTRDGLQEATKKGDNSEVERILSEADLHTYGGVGETPLNGAVFSGKSETIKLLKKAGA